MFVWSESNHAELTKGCFKELEAFITDEIASNAILIELIGNTLNLRKILFLEKYDNPTSLEYGWVESVHLSTSHFNE